MNRLYERNLATCGVEKEMESLNERAFERGLARATKVWSQRRKEVRGNYLKVYSSPTASQGLDAEARCSSPPTACLESIRRCLMGYPQMTHRTETATFYWHEAGSCRCEPPCVPRRSPANSSR